MGFLQNNNIMIGKKVGDCVYLLPEDRRVSSIIKKGPSIPSNNSNSRCKNGVGGGVNFSRGGR